MIFLLDCFAGYKERAEKGRKQKNARKKVPPSIPAFVSPPLSPVYARYAVYKLSS